MSVNVTAASDRNKRTVQFVVLLCSLIVLVYFGMIYMRTVKSREVFIFYEHQGPSVKKDCKGGPMKHWHNVFDRSINSSKISLNELKQLAFLTGVPKVNIDKLSVLLNFQRFLSSKKGKAKIKPLGLSTQNVSMYNYTVVLSTNGALQIEIKETLKRGGKPSRGGTSFKILFEDSTHIFYCDMTDQFNGSYVSVCPKINIKGQTHVTIKVMYLDFCAYRRTTQRPLDVIIYSKMIHPTAGRIISDGLVPHWTKVSGEYKWSAGNCYVPHYNKNDIETCLSRVSSISFVGDSNLRYLYYYTQFMRDHLPHQLKQKLRNNTSSNMESYFYKTYSSVVVTFLEDDLRRLKLASRTGKNLTSRVIVMNVGEWDLAFKEDISNYFMNIIKIAKLLKDINMFPSRRIIWFTLPSFPEFKTVALAKMDRRNNFMIQAANQFTLLQFENSGIEIVHSFPMMYSRVNEVIDGHYLLIKPSDTNKDFGKVGVEFANLLLHKICT